MEFRYPKSTIFVALNDILERSFDVIHDASMILIIWEAKANSFVNWVSHFVAKRRGPFTPCLCNPFENFAGKPAGCRYCRLVETSGGAGPPLLSRNPAGLYRYCVPNLVPNVQFSGTDLTSDKHRRTRSIIIGMMPPLFSESSPHYDIFS